MATHEGNKQSKSCSVALRCLTARGVLPSQGSSV